MTPAALSNGIAKLVMSGEALQSADAAATFGGIMVV